MLLYNIFTFEVIFHFSIKTSKKNTNLFSLILTFEDR